MNITKHIQIEARMCDLKEVLLKNGFKKDAVIKHDIPTTQ